MPRLVKVEELQRGLGGLESGGVGSSAGVELIAKSWREDLRRGTSVGVVASVESWRDHASAVVKLSAAISAASVLSVGMVLVDFAMVGRLGATELGGAALGTTWFSLVNHTMSGAATSLDTLFAQAFGAQQLDRYGDFLRAGLFALGALCVPCAIVLALCEPLLVKLPQLLPLRAFAFTTVTSCQPEPYRWRWGRTECLPPWRAAIACG